MFAHPEAHMINGAHVVLYTTNPKADRAFFRDVLHFPFVDAGHGWLIFALPPAEAAFHDLERNGVESNNAEPPAARHELFLMCDDLAATLRDLQSKNVAVSAVNEQRWGSLATLTLPGGSKLGIYQPKHPKPRHSNS
jgi:catechol 2,3-dioxygenase-like lactoylglutathione lyase family enzyme